MRAKSWLSAVVFPLVGVAILSASGCGGTSAPVPAATNQAPAAINPAGDVAENWCVEHGVPEDICGLCNAKVAAECKQKGDWCKEHNRPESQCFLCNPKLQAKFAAEYEVKYGKKPPAAEGK